MPKKKYTGVSPKVFTPGYDRSKRSTRHEHRIADMVGGRRLPRSGGLPWSPREAFEAFDPLEGGGRERTAQADIATNTFLIEHKRTEKKSMSVKLDWLLKVKEGAVRSIKTPALVITFERGSNPPEDWAVIPMELFKRIVDESE